MFEYWTHAASYLPMKDYRFTLYKKNHVRNGDKHWFKKDKKLMQHILDRIKTEGPLMSKDFEDTRKEKQTSSRKKPSFLEKDCGLLEKEEVRVF